MNKAEKPAALAALMAAFMMALLPALPSGADASEYSFITCTDYETGVGSVIWLDDPHTADPGVASIHSDAVSRWFEGLIYVVNRQNGDNIQVLDPGNGFTTIAQHSTGNGTNPSDIALLTPNKAYVTRYDSNILLIMDPVTGAQLGTIDLSAFADSDGLCEMDKALIVGDVLFVAVQRLDRNNWWGPVGDSYLAVIDCSADTLVDTDPSEEGVQGIPLAAPDPFSDIIYDDSTGLIYVSCVGWWGTADGGIEAVDPVAFSPAGIVLTESAAGGDINDFTFAGGSKGYAVIATAEFNTELVSFDRDSGTRTGTLYAPGAYVINDIEISPYGELFAADQTPTAPGIRIFDTSTGLETTSSPVDTGLPPFDITFSKPGSPAPARGVPAAVFGPCHPNPFNPTGTIPYTLESPGNVEIAVYNAEGARIRSIFSGFRPAGAYSASWDGKSDSGSAASSGVYFAAMRCGGHLYTSKLILLR